MAAPSQIVVGDRGKEQWLASLMTPWVDRIIRPVCSKNSCAAVRTRTPKSDGAV